MTIPKAFRAAWRTWRAKPGCWLLLTLVSLCVLGMTFAPLLLLCALPARPLAWVCVPLFAVLVLPLRQYTADLLVRALRGEEASLWTLPLGMTYTTALRRGLKGVLCLLPWSLPTIVVSAWLVAQYKGAQDVFSLMRMISVLGGGTAVDGLWVGAGIYLGTFVLVLVGCAFHGGNRFAVAQGRRMRGRRLGSMGCWLCSQITLLPFLAGVAILVGSSIPQISAALAARSLALLPDGASMLRWVALDAVVLLCPTLPLRALIQAAYASGEAGA